MKNKMVEILYLIVKCFLIAAISTVILICSFYQIGQLISAVKEEFEFNVTKRTGFVIINRDHAESSPSRSKTSERDDKQNPNKGTEKTSETVQEKIQRVAKEEGFEEVEKLVKLAKCESNFKHNAKNTNGGHSLDRGVFQINKKYHPEISDECAFDVECSTKAAIKIQKARGWDEWAKTTLICMNK